MSITTILQLYRRPSYLKEQLEAIRKQTVPSTKIIAVHNEGGVKFNYPDEIDNVIYAYKNMKYHLRFAIGLLATTEYVAFFDDDTIPGENLYKNMLEIINKHKCIVVGNGRIIKSDIKQWDCPGWGNPSETEIECDFGGHFWGLKKEYLQYMWHEEPVTYTNCEDMMLSFNCFRFGKIKTFVLPHPISDKTQWSSLKGAELGSDSVASWIVNPTHFEERWNTIFEYINRGYKPVLTRKDE